MCIFLFSNFSYKRRGVYRKKYLNEVWALIDGTDYLVSFLDTSESREYINRSSRGHLINSLPVLKLSEEELEELKKRGPHKPTLRYKYTPSSSVNQSGTLYERYEMSRLAGLNGHLRHSLPPLYSLGNGEDYDKDGNEKDQNSDSVQTETIEMVVRTRELMEEEEEENEDINDNDLNVNDIKNENNNENSNNNKNGGNENDDDNLNNSKNGENANDDDNLNNSKNGENANDKDNLNNNKNSNNSENSNDGEDLNLKERSVNLNNDDESDEGIIVHDIQKDRPYPPGLGPNELGIDAFDLQQRALREDQMSSDDGDERPSNCGCGHDGSGEVVLQISLKDFLPSVNQENKNDFTINNVPRSEWETIRAKGFDWILFEDLPPNTNFKELATILHSCRLKAMMDYQSDEPLKYFDGFRVRDSDVAPYRRRFQDKTIVSVQAYEFPQKISDENKNDQNSLKYATYVYDNRPIECLRAKDAEAFARVIRKETTENDRCRLLHYMCTQNLNFNPRSTRTAAAMLLTLPGMRVIDFTEIQLVDLVLIVLCKKAVRRGVFSFVNYKSTGNTFAWKYTRGKQHILIVANFDTRQTTTTIICDDCPEPIKSGKGKKDNGKVAFVDILSQTTYLRDPEEMRTKGLNVILYEYEAQIFEY